jgi:hypothetical protein
MAKSKRVPPAPTDRGPYLGAAIIAESILREDVVHSAIRIVDRIGLPVEAEQTPNGTQVRLPLQMMVIFKSGSFAGKRLLKLVQVSPSRERVLMGTAEITFDGKGDTGVNLTTPVQIVWNGIGRYWVEVFLDNHFYTKLSLHLNPGGPLIHRPTGDAK